MVTFARASSQHQTMAVCRQFVLWCLAICLSICALSVQALSLTGVQSRKTHLLGTGTYGLPVDTTQSMSGSITVESRVIGTGHSIVFQFDGPVASTGILAVIDETLVNVAGVFATRVNNEVTVTLPALADRKRVTISLTNVNGVGLNVSASLGFLLGDINSSGSVSASDVSAVKARAGMSASAATFQYDLNTSGIITAADISAVKARVSTILVPVNNAPVINSTAPTPATEGTLYTYNATRNDPDGPGQTWSLLGPHTCGGSIVPTTGVFTFTPAGPVPPVNCVVAIQVCDGGTPNLCATQTTTIAITAVNDAPVINSTAPTTAIEDTLYTYNPTRVDPDGPGQTWNLLGTHTCGGSIVPATGAFTFTPAGPVPPVSCVVAIQVCDGGTPNLCASQTTTIAITAVNDAPTANGYTLLPAQAGIPINYPPGKLGGIDPDGTAITINLTPDSLCSGCLLALNADGSFTFTPSPAAAGTTVQFTYHVTDSGSPGPGLNSVPATVSFSVAGPAIFFVKQAAVGIGNCTLGNECTLATAVTAIGATTNTRIFIGDAGLHAAAVPLNSGGWLIGQGATGTTFDTLFGIGVPMQGTLVARPGINAVRPTLQSTVTVNAGSTLRGLNIATAGTTGLLGGAVVGVVINDASVNATTATGINFSGTGATMTLDGVSSSGGVNNINLTNVTGTLTINNVTPSALSGASAASFLVNGGTATVSYAGTVNQAAAGQRVVDIQNKTGGTITLGGAVSSTGGTGTGIFLNANTGATVNFTGGIALTTNANAAFTATGGGTLNVTQNNTTIINTLTTTTGTALNVANTTIGASGASFRSIASNGAVSGIVVNNTGTSGGLTITGNGGSCTSAGTCTGGAIQNSTGDGVVLTSTQSPSLTRLNIADSAGAATDDGLIMTNVGGTVTIDNCAIQNNPHNGITIDNLNTNMAGFNLTNSTISCASGQPCQPSGTLGNDGLLLQMRGTSVLTSGVISGSTFGGHRAVGVQIQTNDSARIGSNAGGSITASITVQNNTFTGNGQGIDIDNSQISNLTFQVLNNTINGKLTAPGAVSNQASSNAINAFTAAGADTGPASHSFVGKIDGNVIGTQGVKDSGSGFGSGIRVVVQGQNTQGVVVVSNNTIRETANADILNFFGQNGAATTGTGSARFKITNNLMPAPSGSNLSLCGPANTACASNGIFVLADEGNPVCNIITLNNIYDVSIMNGSFGIYLAERTGPPAGAQLTVEGTGGSNSAYIMANNTLAGSLKFVDEGTNTSQVAASACGAFPP